MVLALMPAAGDVDVMITAEMMEAGRAIIRGFVTPDRTVQTDALIDSALIAVRAASAPMPPASPPTLPPLEVPSALPPPPPPLPAEANPRID